MSVVLTLLFCLSGQTGCHEVSLPAIQGQTAQQCYLSAQFRAVEWLDEHPNEPGHFVAFRCGAAEKGA